MRYLHDATHNAGGNRINRATMLVLWLCVSVHVAVEIVFHSTSPYITPSMVRQLDALNVLLSDNSKKSNKTATATATVTTQEADNAPTTTMRKPAVHLVTIADQFFATRYKPYFIKMEEYCNLHKYTWKLLATEDYGVNVCPQRHAMFRGMCMVADYMLNHTQPGDVVVFFDADYVVYRPWRSLTDWVDTMMEDNIDLVLYDRGFLDEIASGSYFVRHRSYMADFLREWANYETHQPKGFSSADNGSMHLVLLHYLGAEARPADVSNLTMAIETSPPGSCAEKYYNLTAMVNNLQPYQGFLQCTRQYLAIGKHRSSAHSIAVPEPFGLWIVSPDGDPWCVDWGAELKDKNVQDGAIFHHGVKIQSRYRNRLKPEFIEKYNLTGMVEPLEE